MDGGEYGGDDYEHFIEEGPMGRESRRGSGSDPNNLYRQIAKSENDVIESLAVVIGIGDIAPEVFVGGGGEEEERDKIDSDYLDTPDSTCNADSVFFGRGLGEREKLRLRIISTVATTLSSLQHHSESEQHTSAESLALSLSALSSIVQHGNPSLPRYSPV